MALMDFIRCWGIEPSAECCRNPFTDNALQLLCTSWHECWHWWRIHKTRSFALGRPTSNQDVWGIPGNSPPVSMLV